jgi:hypothetical protein
MSVTSSLVGHYYEEPMSVRYLKATLALYLDFWTMGFQYDELPRTGQKFARYIVLDPGHMKAPLTGRIVTSALDAFPPYHAVSYVWGDPTKVDKLQCHNGGEVSITENLSAALRRIRHQSGELVLWVDQLSINQDDLEERGSQVAMMGDIYAKAESTFICLGSWETPTEDTDDLAALVHDVNVYVDEQLSRCNGDWYQLLQAVPGDQYYDDPRWDSYSAMMRSLLFVRVWCIQEAGVSKNPRLLFGSAEFEWHPVFRVSAYLRDAGFPIANKFNIVGHATHLGRAWLWGDNQAGSTWNLHKRMTLSKDRIPGLSWHLLELLNDSRSAYVTDNRDYLYAFLGQKLLAKIMGPPDYKADHNDIYRHFAVQWLRETGDLNILAYVQRGHRRPSDHKSRSSLRTWMPNWAHYGTSVISQFRDRKWEAGGEASGTDLFAIHEKTHFLQIQATAIDSIAFCSPVFTIFDFSLAENTGHESTFETMSAAWPESLHQVFDPNSTCAYPSRLLPFAATMTVGGVGDDDYGMNMAAAYLSLHYGDNVPVNGPVPQQIAHGRTEYEVDPAPALWFESRASMPGVGRRFIITENGFYGLAPAMSDVGDRCCALKGARAAYILRDVPELDGHCEIIGEAYIQGAMLGELANDDAAQWHEILLI